MPDYAGVYANTTVTEYLDFFARAHDLRGDARRQAVANIIDFMGIGDLRDRHVESLSKGLKQRVALGRAIVHDPQVLILDEPAANLDPRARSSSDADPRAGRRRQDDPPQLAHPHRARRDVRHRDGDRERQDPGDRHGEGHPRGRAAAGILSVRLAGPRWHRAIPRRTTRRAERPRGRRARVEFEFDGGDDDQVLLVSRLIAAGFPVLEFSAHSAGLEDLFIEITEGRVQ